MKANGNILITGTGLISSMFLPFVVACLTFPVNSSGLSFTHPEIDVFTANIGISLSNTTNSYSGESAGSPQEESETPVTPVSPAGKASISFQRYKNLHSDPARFRIFEEQLFSTPDSLSTIEKKIYLAQRYLERSMPDKAIPLLLQTLDSLSRPSDQADFSLILLSEAYREKQEYSKGIQIIREILSSPKDLSLENQAYAFNRLAALYNEWGQPKPGYTDSVFKYSERCMTIAERINHPGNMGLSQNELSYQYLTRRQYPKALELSIKAAENFSKARMPYCAINTLINQSNIYLEMNEPEKALQALERAEGFCPLEENRNLFMRLYQQYARIYLLTGAYREANVFLNISYQLLTDFFKDRIDMQINEQSARFDLLMKEQKLREEKQKNEFRQKQILFLTIIIIALIISLIISIFYFRLKRKEFLKQKLMEAVVETGENERKRIARDLHDGLGPVLSAINHYFQAYIDSKDSEKETIQARLQQVISGAIDEVSRIAHNISPYILENHGLNTALKNFVNPLTDSEKIIINLSVDLSERFDRNKELTVYRCITELISNTLKHAHADEISISVSAIEKILIVHYTDNGKGFEVENHSFKGMGLHNIKNRVESFGGKLKMESSSISGTRVNIELPL